MFAKKGIRSVFRVLVSAFAILVASLDAALAVNDETCQLTSIATSVVSQVISGSAIALENGETVRLVGIDLGRQVGRRAVTTGDEAAGGNTRVDQGNARQVLAEVLLGQEVEIAVGGRKKDRYGRILAHVYLLRDGERLWMQGVLVEKGLARVSSFSDNRSCIRRLLALEDVAREQSAGLWKSRFQILSAKRTKLLLKRKYSFQIVEGICVKVAQVRGRVFLNFDKDWRRDFTIAIAARDRKRFGGRDTDFSKFEGKKLRVRGWVERWNGPVIKVTHPEQIEVVGAEKDRAS